MGFALCLVSLGGCPTVPFALDSVPVGYTKYCINTDARPYVAVSGIFPFFHDTFVFFAITWKLTKNTHKEITPRTGVRVALLGDYLPAFSRALLVVYDAILHLVATSRYALTSDPQLYL